MQFPGARGTFGGGKPATPKVSPRNCATFLHFPFWPTAPPGAGNREILGWGFKPFWPRTALDTNAGRKTEKHNFPGPTGV